MSIDPNEFEGMDEMGFEEPQYQAPQADIFSGSYFGQEEEPEEEMDEGLDPNAEIPEPTFELYPGAVDYNIPLDDEELDQLGRDIIEAVTQYYEDVSDRIDNCEVYRADFEGMQADGDGPWEGSAKVRAPLSENAVRGHHTRLNQQIIHAVPPFVVEARVQEAIDAVPLIEEALTARLEEADWKSVANEVHSELPLVGNCFLRVTYEHNVKRVPRHQVEWDDEAYAQLVEEGVDPVQAMEMAVVKDKTGKAKVTLEWQNQLVSEGVVFQMVPFEDGLIIPATIRDPEDCVGIGQRLFIRGADLKQGVRRGQYRKKMVDEILGMGSDPIPQDRMDNLDNQAIMGGSDSHYTGSNPLYREYEFYQLCWQMDANKDDELEWTVVTVHKSGRVIQAQYLPYHHGKPFYVMFRYLPRARELFAMGVCEKITCIQDAATAVLNQLINHADLCMNVFGNLIYEKSSGFDPDKHNAEMGTPIACDNIDGIKNLDISPLPPEHYALYHLLKDMADLTTASSNPSLGKATDSTKTLGEVQIVASASNMIFEEFAAGVARDWAKVWDMVRWLYGQYGSGGKVTFRKTAMPSTQFSSEQNGGPQAKLYGQTVPAPGGAVFDSIPSHMMYAEVDLVPAGLKQLADMQSRVQQASLVQSTLLQHPLLGMDIDAQLLLLDEYLQAMRWPQRDKMMEIANRAADKQRQAMMMQEMMQQAMLQAGMPADGSQPAAGGPGGGAGTPGSLPEEQGPAGAPSGLPGGGAATGPEGVPLPPQGGGYRG